MSKPRLCLVGGANEKVNTSKSGAKAWRPMVEIINNASHFIDSRDASGFTRELQFLNLKYRCKCTRHFQMSSKLRSMNICITVRKALFKMNQLNAVFLEKYKTDQHFSFSFDLNNTISWKIQNILVGRK